MKYILDRKEIQEAVVNYVKAKAVGLLGKGLDVEFFYKENWIAGAEVQLTPEPTQEKKITPKSE